MLSESLREEASALSLVASYFEASLIRDDLLRLAMAMAAAAATAVVLIGSPGRSAPTIPGAAVAPASIGHAALGPDASSETPVNRASRPTVSDKASSQRAFTHPDGNGQARADVLALVVDRSHGQERAPPERG